VYANCTSFFKYNGGIYNDADGDCKPDWAYYDAEGNLKPIRQVDHVVNLVGYGYDSDTKSTYFILRNSWGTSWGEDGYMRILAILDDDGIANLYKTV